jgi:hypothetical protein
MLLKFREISQPDMIGSPFPRLLTQCIIDYDQVLLGMPSAMGMNRGTVRRHLVWKRMLAASADGQIKFGQMAPADIERMSCDGAGYSSSKLPSWLPHGKLASQIQCPAELLLMWASLWGDALELDGAASAIFNDAQSLTRMLKQYLTCYSHPPSPRSLMQHHLGIAQGVDADPDITDAEGVPAKRRCMPRVGAEAPIL